MEANNNQVEFTPAKVKLLRKAYNSAVASKLDQFEFEGNQYVTGYAKYLLEYLDQKFGSKQGNYHAQHVRKDGH